MKNLSLKTILFILSSILLFSCNDDERNFNKKNNLNNEKQLFSELFFGNNPDTRLSHVEDLVNMKSSLSYDQLQEVKRIENIILDNITRLDKSFFSEFNDAMTSGDHLKIQNKLKEGGEMLEKALLNTPEIAEEVMLGKELANKIDIRDFTNEDGTLNTIALNDYVKENLQEEVICGPTFCVVGVYLAAAVSVAVAVNYAGAINVYVWVNAFKWTNGPNKKRIKESLAESKLQEEILINEIATFYKN